MQCHPGQMFKVMQGVVLLQHKSGQLHNYHTKNCFFEKKLVFLSIQFDCWANIYYISVWTIPLILLANSSPVCSINTYRWTLLYELSTHTATIHCLYEYITHTMLNMDEPWIIAWIIALRYNYSSNIYILMMMIKVINADLKW